MDLNEIQEEKLTKGASERLRRVVDFLRQFPQFPDIFMRFLQPPDGTVTSLVTVAYNSLAEFVDGIEDTETVPADAEDDEAFYLTELLLARYARKLLFQQQMRRLLRFAKHVNHDLKSW